MTSYLAIIIQLIFIPVFSPMVIGIIRKFKARMQNRTGPSIIQPYRDLYKLLQKDEVLSEHTSWISRYAPVFVFASTLAAAAYVPLLLPGIGWNSGGDFLVVVYLLLLGTFFLGLLGMDAGSSFGGFGSSREMTVSMLSEGGLVGSLFALALLAKSTNLADMSITVSSLPLEALVPVVFAGIAFYISLLAETARYPFDNPATHLELTMIHEAMILESSGKRLALLEWASANKLLIFLVLGANLYLSWLYPSVGSGGLLSILHFIVFIGVVLFITASIGVLESTIAKVRYFRIPDVLFTSLILALLAIIVIIV